MNDLSQPGGFPPIDQLYYEKPSVRLGGYLAFALMKHEGGAPKFNLVPGESTYANGRHQHFDSLAHLSEFLQSEDREEYFYRGQTKRRRVGYCGRVNTLAQFNPSLSPLTVTFESLMPSIFRPRLTGESARWDQAPYPTPLNTIAAAARAIARSGNEELREHLKHFLMDLRFIAVNNLLIELGANPAGGLPEQVPLTNISRRLATLVSLSQHYELSSCMVDITADPKVAVWFASHTWVGDLDRSAGDGVVYRFNASAINCALNKELNKETPARAAIFGAGLLGLVDISHQSKEFGLRPQRQLGGSIMGMENSVALYILDVYRALDVFTFPLVTTTGEETKLSKEYLAPSDDPLLKVFDTEARTRNEAFTADEIARIALDLGLDSEDAEELRRASAAGLI